MKYAKQKGHFFQQPQILAFLDFLKLEVFPEENPTQKLANSLVPCRNWQKNSFTDLSFLARNSQSFEKDYKITIKDKTFISNIPKIQIIPYRNEGAIVFSKKIHNQGNNPVCRED